MADVRVITLPSSAKNPPGNVGGRFTTILSNRIQLEEKYELGLKQINYPKLWDNVVDGKNTFYVMITPSDKTYELHAFALPSGYYETIDYLLEQMHGMISVKLQKDQAPIFSFDKHKHRLDVSLAQHTAICFGIHSSLCSMLGASRLNYDGDTLFIKYDQQHGYKEMNGNPFKQVGRKLKLSITLMEKGWNPIVFVMDENFKNIQALPRNTRIHSPELLLLMFSVYRQHYIEKTAEKNAVTFIGEIRKVRQLMGEVRLETIPRLYVYASIISNQFVGNQEIPLLKIVNVEGKHGDVVDVHYTNALYAPVYKSIIDTIEIWIADDHGAVVDFKGHTVVVVELRKIDK